MEIITIMVAASEGTESQPTQDALLWWRRHDISIWSMFFRQLLIEAEEVAEASPHCECLAAEHGQ